jgi:hypothetical protein
VSARSNCKCTCKAVKNATRFGNPDGNRTTATLDTARRKTYASGSAAIPGKMRPSRYSNEAPPPVEI